MPPALALSLEAPVSTSRPPRRWFRLLSPSAGGWRYDHADRAHYGAGAVVCLAHTGRWEVYDYREIAAPLPVPWRDFATADEAKAAWDIYARGLKQTAKPLPSGEESP